MSDLLAEALADAVYIEFGDQLRDHAAAERWAREFVAKYRAVMGAMNREARRPIENDQRTLDDPRKVQA